MAFEKDRQVEEWKASWEAAVQGANKAKAEALDQKNELKNLEKRLLKLTEDDGDKYWKLFDRQQELQGRADETTMMAEDFQNQLATLKDQKAQFLQEQAEMEKERLQQAAQERADRL